MENKSGSESFWLPLFVVVLGAFAAILNNSSVNIALPKMMEIFGVSPDEIQWVLTSYMLTSGVVIPVTGYLGDTYGAKRIYILCLTVFTAGSVLCGLAWNNNTMIAARIIQGIGGGTIIPVSMTIVYRMVPRNMIGTALGVWGMAAITAPAIGPTLGGYIIEHASWRFLFTMNVPVGILAILLGGMLLPETPIKKGLKFDYPGFITSTLGCFTLLLALSQGQKEGWSSFYIVTLLAISFFMLLLFVMVELYTAQPMLDLRIFKNRAYSVSVFGGSIITVGLFGGVFLIPLFTQNLMGKTAMETGMILMPAALVTAVMMPVSGFLFDRIGPKVVTFTGLVLLAWGTWEFKYLSSNSSSLYIVMMASIRSLGIGLSLMPMTTAGMNTISPQDVSRASALNNVCRQVCASLGIAILTSVMQNRQAFHFSRIAESVSINSFNISAAANKTGIMADLTTSAGQQSTLSLLNGLAARESLVLAINDTFMVASIILASAIFTSFFLDSSQKKDSAAGSKIE